MSLKVGKSIPVATNFVKSNPAVPVYNGEETMENLYAVIYHIEIGYNKDDEQEVLQYVIVDYKDYSLSEEGKASMLEIANEYCREKNIDGDKNLEIKLLDNEIAENFIEKIFNNMKVIRGLISND
ncbi:hypothetical protein [Peptostreptococcus faecalis]|uniref:hypothetical protein n=1 Tax=Peptostreptococcus faecalis TaxID=2045015 RepID=UPI000C7D04E3|nr:hypothetical protein [Peptostreptococcus faecalis]